STRTMSTRTTILAAFAASASAAVLGGAPAAADVTSAAWSSSSQYIYEVAHMPDLDQKRAGSEAQGGLPGEGSMYCVPTSIMNLFAYAANHGFPQLLPGPANWQSQSNYVTASDFLRIFGALCGTDPQDGTAHGPAASAAQVWILPVGSFVVDEATADGDWSPTANTLASKAIGGAIVAFCYGRYEILADDGDSVVVGSRLSGHCVTLRKVARSGSAIEIESRDPGDGGNDFTQSPFGSQVYTGKNHFVLNTAFTFARTMTSLNHPIGDDVIRLIDSYVAIRPKAGYSWSSSGGPQINITTPFPLDPVHPPLVQIDLGSPADQVLTDAAPLLDAVQVAVVTEAATGLAQLGVASLIDGAYVEIGPSVPRARIVVGRRGQLYHLRANVIECYDLTQEEPLIGSLVLPAAGADIAYDDATDQVVVYAPQFREIYVAPRLLGALETYILPETVPIAGEGTMTVGPGSGIWLHPDGAEVLVKAMLPEQGDDIPNVEMLFSDSIPTLTGFDVDDDERVFVCADGEVEEYMYSEQDDAWMPSTDSPSGLRGTPCDGGVLVARSRSNFDPETMTGPGWHDTPPEDLVHMTFMPDCVADIDGDGVVDVTDLLEVIIQWGPCPSGCLADVNADGAVDVADMTAVIVAWGACNESSLRSGVAAEEPAVSAPSFATGPSANRRPRGRSARTS
ncbi:MAG: hypothetical protein ACYTGR_20180, partial [Planctomycetota bacterium]